MVNDLEFRERMNALWKSADDAAEAAKEGYIATKRLKEFYLSLNNDERRLANGVIQEWLTSTDARLRFDAFVMVDSLHILDLVPALNDLVTRLSPVDSPSARAERDTVRRIVDGLRHLPGGG